MIEHKKGEATKLVALLTRMNLIEDVLVQSFDWEFISEVHRLEPRITLGVLGGSKSRPRPDLAEIKGTGAQLVHWKIDRLLPEDAGALRRLAI